MASGTRIGNAYVNIVPEMDGFTSKLNGEIGKADTSKGGKKLGESLGSSAGKPFAQSFGKSLKSLGGTLSDLGGKLTSGITVPLAGATAAVGAFAIKTASAAETTEISFTTMLGSAEAATEMMDTLSDFAAHTPFELSGLQTATRQLLAYGFTADEVVPMLTAVGDATAALGTGQYGIEAVTRALGQMQTRGKVSAEEMLQLTEQGIPAWQYLAEAIGTDTAGAMEKVSEGAVTASQGIEALTSGMERDFGGMMEAQSKTLEGLMSNLADAIEQPLMKLRESDAYDSLVDSLSRMVDAAEPFVESVLPHMEDGLEVVSDVLDMATDAMDEFADMSEDSQEKVLQIATGAAAAGPALTILGKGMEFVGGVVKPASKGLSSLSDGLLDLATSPKTANTVLGTLAGTISQFPGVAALAVGGIALLVSGVVSFIDSATEADREARTEAEAIQILRSATDLAADSMDGAGDSTEYLGTKISDLGDDIQENWQSIADLGDTFSEINRETTAQVDQLNNAKQSIQELTGQTDLSTQQLGAFRSAIELVNDQCGTNYEVVKDTGGAYQIMADGATVAKDEVLKLIDAQIQQTKIDAYSEKLKDVYKEQAEQAEEYAEALRQVSEAQQAYDDAVAKYGEQGANWALDDLNEAKNNLAEVENQMELTGDAANSLETAIGNISEGGAQSFDALVEGSMSLQTYFEGNAQAAQEFADDLEASGVSLQALGSMSDVELAKLAASWDGTTESIVNALSRQEGAGQAYTESLSASLQAAGVSTQQLNAIGTANIQALATAFNGNISSMVWAINNYNNVPIINKDGTVRIEDSELIDSQGRIYTWNGSYLVDQDGNVAVEDQELIDAQGRVYTWNGTALEPKSTSVTVDTSSLSNALSMADLWNRTTFKNKSAGVYINNVPSVMATGGVIPHAEGFIATGPTFIGGNHLIGEAGAEAYFRQGGSSYVVPLTNRKYSAPFADIVAQQVAGYIGGGSRQPIVYQTNNFNQPVTTPAQYARQVRRYATYGLAGSRR